MCREVSHKFDRDIMPLFSEYDRDQMRFAFDLWSCDEVRNNAARILARLESGEMPCDQSWSSDRIAIFRDWFQQEQEL